MERMAPQKDQTPLAGGAGGQEQGDAESLQHIVVGRWPKRKETVTSEVLSLLLRGKRLPGLDAVFSAATTRLADTVHRLQKNNGWVALSEPKYVGTSDGRAQTIAVYALPKSVTAFAMRNGGREFCATVATAKANQRANRHLAEHRAAQLTAEGGRFERP